MTGVPGVSPNESLPETRWVLRVNHVSSAVDDHRGSAVLISGVPMHRGCRRNQFWSMIIWRTWIFIIRCIAAISSGFLPSNMLP